MKKCVIKDGKKIFKDGSYIYFDNCDDIKTIKRKKLLNLKTVNDLKNNIKKGK